MKPKPSNKVTRTTNSIMDKFEFESKSNWKARMHKAKQKHSHKFKGGSQH